MFSQLLTKTIWTSLYPIASPVGSRLTIPCMVCDLFAALLFVARFAGPLRVIWCVCCGLRPQHTHHITLSERRRRKLADNSQILRSPESDLVFLGSVTYKYSEICVIFYGIGWRIV